MLPCVVVSCLSDSRLERVALFSASDNQWLHCIDDVCYITLMLSSCNDGSSASALLGTCLSQLRVIYTSPNLDIIDRRFASPVMS
jgi:methylthioribose-1-phosphate isomerase